MKFDTELPHSDTNSEVPPISAACCSKVSSPNSIQCTSRDRARSTSTSAGSFRMRRHPLLLTNTMRAGDDEEGIGTTGRVVKLLSEKRDAPPQRMRFSAQLDMYCACRDDALLLTKLRSFHRGVPPTTTMRAKHVKSCIGRSVVYITRPPALTNSVLKRPTFCAPPRSRKRMFVGRTGDAACRDRDSRAGSPPTCRACRPEKMASASSERTCQ
mmetsp:Transcript_7030/g.17787  ORF Transcript_7030/g.17787 Transcript_7030/m.17787 type:complete len:213 (+) Transcript_7030:613-1251(+)